MPSRAIAIAEQVSPPFDPLVVTTAQGRVVELAGHEDGGVARAGDTVVALARMEFSLITALLERRRRAADPERAYMAWGELAGSLEFRGTGPADSDNVRELVRRVRKKLSTAGLDDLIGSRQGIGYRLNGTPRD